LRGPEGGGKKLAARTLHALSPRRSEPFLAIDCSEVATASGLLDRLSDRPIVGAGANDPAIPNGGILYLDEVALAPPEVQRALMRGLSDGTFGVDDSAKVVAPRVRLLAASSRNVDRDVEQGLFLEELAAKLGQSIVHLPPLNERPEDIALLARHFIDTIVEINHLQAIRISPEALGILERHAWPGNVRQLRNAMEHAVILATEGVVRSKDLPEWVSEAPPVAAAVDSADVGAGRRFKAAKREVVEAFERAYLCRLLEDHRGNVTAASQEAGMLRSALQRLLRKYGLKSASFRKRHRGPSKPEITTR
jgi:DNA-binding NtrC family response regulator